MPEKKSNKHKTLSILLIAVSAFLLSFVLMLLYPVQVLELKFKDQLFEWRGPLDVSESPIVLVAISQDADEEIRQKWPWPTNIHAKLIKNLNEAGAKVIAFDVIFDNYDENPKNDTLFAEALQEYGNVILTGELERDEGEFAGQISPTFPNHLLSSYNPNRVGMVRVPVDIDGAIRSYNFGVEHQGTDYYRLALEIVRLYNSIPYDQIDPLVENERDYFTLGDNQISKDRPNSFLINYYGGEKLFPTISYEEVIDDSSYKTVMEEAGGFDINTFNDSDYGHLAKGTFENKIVIVGPNMSTLKDFYTTPFANEGNNDRPGFEIHAHALQTILDANYLQRIRGWYTLLIMLVLCFGISFINRFFSANIGVLISVITGLGYFGISYLAFIEYNLFMVLTGPILAIGITQISMVGFEFYLEQKEKRRIRGMFASYVSPELVRQMIESGEEPQLGGEETFMTAFFSDIVSFSTFSEQLGAKELVQLINEYLSSMTDILNRKGGTLDKYIGDAIVSFFGSPVYMPDHALQACISTQLMHKELARLRNKWKEDGWPDVVVNMRHRIGLNTGLMVTGNMGSSRRFNYTMMGDNVNLAARCESGAKQYGVFTMVTESTKNEAEKYGDDCVFRLLDHIIVKGKTKPVKVYEIVALRADASKELYDCIGLYEEGMEYYFKQEWDKAIIKFEASKNLECYEQNPSIIFIKRCEMMKMNPPGEDWNGVFMMTSK